MYIGIDLGTSGIKVILLGENGKVIDSASAELLVSRPQPLWSEQNPEHWWLGLQSCMDQLSQRQSLASVKAIGLAGQMHGATLLDDQNQIIRPAILWNDGRSFEQCQQLELKVADLPQITGNLAMQVLPHLNYFGYASKNHKLLLRSPKYCCQKIIYVFA